jgi:hypothetical protein
MRFADTVHRAALVDFTLQMRIMVLLQLSRMPALDDGNAIDRNVMELINDMRANAVPVEHLAVLSGTRASRECATLRSALRPPNLHSSHPVDACVRQATSKRSAPTEAYAPYA